MEGNCQKTRKKTTTKKKTKRLFSGLFCIFSMFNSIIGDSTQHRYVTKPARQLNEAFSERVRGDCRLQFKLNSWLERCKCESAISLLTICQTAIRINTRVSVIK